MQPPVAHYATDRGNLQPNQFLYRATFFWLMPKYYGIKKSDNDISTSNIWIVMTLF